jgi:hypothetical protein
MQSISKIQSISQKPKLISKQLRRSIEIYNLKKVDTYAKIQAASKYIDKKIFKNDLSYILALWRKNNNIDSALPSLNVLCVQVQMFYPFEYRVEI